METGKRSVVARDWEEGEVQRQSTEVFPSDGTVFSDPVRVDHVTACLSRPVHPTPPRVSPDVPPGGDAGRGEGYV